MMGGRERHDRYFILVITLLFNIVRDNIEKKRVMKNTTFQPPSIQEEDLAKTNHAACENGKKKKGKESQTFIEHGRSPCKG